jgi:hypothetical protein
MIRRIIMILILAFVITSCGAAAPVPTEAPIATAQRPPATEHPAIQSLNPPTIEPQATETSTPDPTPTRILPTPTDTPLPTLELPTEPVNAPVRMVWDGTPTYLGDSEPGYAFRLTYDPDLWAVTTDQMGFPALAQRNITACIITPTAGRGLPASTTVEHDVLKTDKVNFDVSVVSENGVKKFVTYTGGDGRIVTAFEVVFDEQSEKCLADAVTVLSTLTSVPLSQATPQS